MQNGTLGQRMRQARTQAKLSLEEVGRRLARAIGRPRAFTAQAVQQWEKNKSDPDYQVIEAFSQLIPCNLVWLMTGVTVERQGIDIHPGLGTYAVRGHVVAIISPEQAIESPIDYSSDDQLHTHTSCSKEAFAFRIFDERNTPEFHEGDTVVIDPQRKPTPGVMAFGVVNGKAVFAKFTRTKRRGKSHQGVSLAPLNDDWDAADLSSKSDRIVGVMIEHTRSGTRPRTR